MRWIAGNPTARPGARDPSPGRRAKLALGVLIALTLVGTLGFMLVEKLGFLDALYMAVITLSTVGYQEVAPSSDAGRMLRIGLIGLHGVIDHYFNRRWPHLMPETLSQIPERLNVV